MARCGCSGGTCSCVVTSSPSTSGITVSGNGSLGSPYVIGQNFAGWNTLTGTYNSGAGFSAYAGTAADVPQYRTFMGGKLVELRGRILGTTWTPVLMNIITAIPTVIRPLRTKWLPVASDDAAGANGQIQITNAGAIVNVSTLPDTWISLDGIIYETD